jgi:anti-sigma-K factor RskA
MTDAENIDGLAAEYVLGSLDPVERMEVAARRHGDPALNDAIKAWERRLGPLSDLVPPLEPPHHVLRNVMRRIDDRQPRVSAKPLPWRRRWPAIAVGTSALAASLAAILIWSSDIPAHIPAKLMAALEKRVDAADEAKIATVAIGFVVNLDLRASTVVVSPLAVPPGSRRDYQLWLITPGTAPPISLGVIDLAETTASPWPATCSPGDLAHATLVVSLEPKGGSASGTPTGPTMFVGKLVQVNGSPRS